MISFLSSKSIFKRQHSKFFPFSFSFFRPPPHHHHHHQFNLFFFFLSLTTTTQGGGGNPLANLGGLMENMKKAQEEAAKVQKELSE